MVDRHASQFDCANCQHRHCDANNPAPFPMWQLDGSDLRTCPKPMITQESREFIQLFPHYQRGHLLVAGGLTDQPTTYLQAMNIIGAALSEASNE